jgi:type IV pilus assembly protein PilV
MKNTLKLHNAKGFLMIEVILAIAILAIGLFAVMSLTTIVIKGNAHSKMVTTATTLAHDKMEYFKGISYANISGTYTVSNDYYLEALVQNNIPSTNTKTVTVGVYWNPGTATSSHKVTLQTIFAE